MLPLLPKFCSTFKASEFLHYEKYIGKLYEKNQPNITHAYKINLNPWKYFNFPLRLLGKLKLFKRIILTLNSITCSETQKQGRVVGVDVIICWCILCATQNKPQERREYRKSVEVVEQGDELSVYAGFINSL